MSLWDSSGFDPCLEERFVPGDPTPYVADVRHAAPTLAAIQKVINGVVATPVALLVMLAATDTKLIIFLSTGETKKRVRLRLINGGLTPVSPGNLA